MTRQQAKANKLKKYFTGKPCIHGHVSERFTVNGRCIECVTLQRVEVDKKYRHSDKGKKTQQELQRGYRESGRRREYDHEHQYWKCNTYKKSRSKSRKKRYDSDPSYREKVIKGVIDRYNRRYRDSIEFRIRENLRSRLKSAFKFQNTKKILNTLDLTGCSPEELRSWLIFQSNWTAPGANLDNYGEWQIDHIIPCAAFDLRCPLQQILCFHWTNLQPLWVEDHKKKSELDIKKMRA